jgi:hypothetical protein
MPVFVPLLVALFGAAAVAVLVYLADLATYNWWTGQLAHLPAGYIRQVAGTTLEYALVSAVLLGGPVFLVLHRLGRVRWWICGLVGFFIGAVPGAVLFWPLRYAPGSVVSVSVVRGGKLVQTVAHGVLTTAGWLEYGQSVLSCALPGALGGLIFWLIWRKVQPVLEQLPPKP